MPANQGKPCAAAVARLPDSGIAVGPKADQDARQADWQPPGQTDHGDAQARSSRGVALV